MPGDYDRRRNAALRELLDELLAIVRTVSRRGPAATADELEYAQRRLEWLADEIWRTVLESPGREAKTAHCALRTRCTRPEFGAPERPEQPLVRSAPCVVRSAQS